MVKPKFWWEKDCHIQKVLHLNNTAFRYFQYNAIYVPLPFHKNPHSFFQSSSGEEENQNIQGCNITTPYKSIFQDNVNDVLAEVQKRAV